MPGQTTKYKIPYAVSADPINQGAIAQMNMANRIELILSNAGIPVPAALLTVDDPPPDAPA
jgi:hypothetical protein